MIVLTTAPLKAEFYLPLTTFLAICNLCRPTSSACTMPSFQKFLQKYNPDNINNELLPSNPDAHTHVKLFRPSIQVAMFWHGEGSHSFMLTSHIFPTMKGKERKKKKKLKSSNL